MQNKIVASFDSNDSSDGETPKIEKKEKSTSYIEAASRDSVITHHTNVTNEDELTDRVYNFEMFKSP